MNTQPFREIEPHNLWLRAVWHHLIQTSQSLTLREMEHQFGEAPLCSLTPQQMLEIAVKNDFFRRIRGNKFYATRPCVKRMLPADQFANIKRVASVWELAA